MTISKRFDDIRGAKAGTEKVRILAFGSSNTDRRISGTHWLDCLDLGIKNKHGRIHHCINSGTGGETSQDLLDRFDTDAELYHPDMAFITIGGNDAAPVSGIDDARFERNMIELYERFNNAGCYVIFQTYYAPIPDDVSPEEYSTFCRYMEIIRNVAAKTNSGLIDHFKRWLPLQLEMPDKHGELMMDAFHVNYIGNLIIGQDIAAEFGCEFIDPCLARAKSYITLMEELNATIKN